MNLSFLVFRTDLLLFFVFLRRYLVGVLANNGMLDAMGAIKGAHFIRLCDLRGIPMLFLQHNPSDVEFLSQTGNAGSTAKARAQMMAILASSEVGY